MKGNIGQKGRISLSAGPHNKLLEPTPSVDANHLAARSDFRTIADALDYAAEGSTGFNFYSGSGVLVERLSYRALRQEAIALARRMLGAGLEPGRRVGIIAETDGDFARAFFACQYAALVPIPLPLPAAFGGKDAYITYLRRMLNCARADALFGPAAIEPWLREAAVGLDLKMVARLCALETVAPALGVLPVQDRKSVAYVQFSSGSTRFPSGIPITQHAFMANTQSAGRSGLKLVEGDRCVSWLPFYHDMGLVGFVLMPMVFQCTVDFISTRDFARRPLLWLELISRNRGTIAYSPSFGYELCVRRAERRSTDGLDLSSWRSAGIGGDLIRPSVLTRFTERFRSAGFDGRAFLPSYGMAEATLALCIAPVGRGAQRDTVDADILEAENRAVPVDGEGRRSRTFILCGGILPNHNIEVRDDARRSLPERRIGRIFVRGPSLMAGYTGMREETSRVLSSEGWLDTGDLGYLLDGQIVVTGRAKDLIIINGRNLWPQDLEWTVETEINGLRSGDVAVFSVFGDSGEEVVVLVHCRACDPSERAALSADVKKVMRGRHSVEARIVLVPPHSLPQTSSGKLSRTRARELYLAGDIFKLSASVLSGAERK